MRLEITDRDTLRVELDVWEQVLAVHPGSLDVPKAQIVRAHLDVPSHGIRELRVPGAFVPGLVKTGTYVWVGRKEFWFTHRWHKAHLVIELHEFARYDRLIFGVDDAETWAARINEWLTDGAEGESAGAQA